MSLQMLVEKYMFKLASRIDPSEKYDDSLVKELANSLIKDIQEQK